jgi:hypothetical protein
MAHEDLLSTIRSEIEVRLAELRPLLVEHEQLLAAAAALDVRGQTASMRPPRSQRRSAGAVKAQASPRERTRVPRSGSKRPRAARGAAREAILAALEHGSHTVRELSVVTAMSGPNVRNNLTRLLAEGAIAKTAREGKTAYAAANP